MSSEPKSCSEKLHLRAFALISLLPRIWKRSSILWVLTLPLFERETKSQIAYAILQCLFLILGREMKNYGFIPSEQWGEMNNLPENNMQHKNLIFYRELCWVELRVWQLVCALQLKKCSAWGRKWKKYYQDLKILSH